MFLGVWGSLSYKIFSHKKTVYLMTIWIIEWSVKCSAWKTKLFRLKILLTQRCLRKQVKIICSSILEKHGSTDIGVKYPYSEQWPPLKTGVTLTLFMSSDNISFSSDKSSINFKETYSSPKHFSTALKLTLLQPQHLGRCTLSVSLFQRNSSVSSKIALLNSCVMCNGNNDT